MIPTYFNDGHSRFGVSHGDCIEIMEAIAKTGFHFQMIFADPPYFLSNGGISVQSGKQVSVNKGAWDKSRGQDEDFAFTLKWLRAARNVLAPNGTIWISGTYHNSFQVATALTDLGYKILNVVTWQKTNPPPNLSCRYFTYSTEFVIWARREKSVPHYFNYDLMRKINGGQQMRDVWTMPAIGRWEKAFGKHPTQKPLALLCRILLASTQENAWVLDPFTGSSTTGIACAMLNRRFLGIDLQKEFLDLSIRRFQDVSQPQQMTAFRKHIPDIQVLEQHPQVCEPSNPYNCDVFLF